MFCVHQEKVLMNPQTTEVFVGQAYTRCEHNDFARPDPLLSAMDKPMTSEDAKRQKPVYLEIFRIDPEEKEDQGHDDDDDEDNNVALIIQRLTSTK